MMIRRLACFVLSIVLCSIAFTCGHAEATVPANSDIAWLIRLLPESLIQAMKDSFSPQSFDCGPAQVTLHEVLYDGVWLFTAAIVTPTDPETTLIMPSTAGMTDFVAGGYGENLRSDPRRFHEAALQDGKDILWVCVDPAVYVEVPYYFTDHRQDAGDQSTVFSGVPLAGLEEALTIRLSIQLGLIDPSAGTFTDIDTYVFPIAVRRVGAINMREYHTGQEGFPFQSLTLIQTPLTVYAFPEGEMESSHHFSLLDGDLAPIPRGSPYGNTCALPDFPEDLNVQIRENTALFIAVDATE